MLRFLLLIFSLNFINCDPNLERLDCAIENKLIQEHECRAKGCIWIPSNIKDYPWCYFETIKMGYTVKNDATVTKSGLSVDLALKKNSEVPFEQIENLKFHVQYLTERIVRFRITDPNHKRYEVPIQSQFPLLMKNPKEEDESKRKYNVSVTKKGEDFHFIITRKETNAKVFDTTIGGMIFTDQFLQIATLLPSKSVYGIGENTHLRFKHDMNYKTWPIFTKDEAPYNNDKNLYGAHPFYTVLENDGKSHGVFLLNSNAMEYTLLPSPGVSIKTVGGIFDFFIFLGENPEHVIQLYTSLIGRTVMPPYWGIGFQLTRYGYRNTDHVKSVIERNLKAKIPMDVHYLDIDYMNKFQDFTYDKTNFGHLGSLMTDTKKNNGIKWALIIDPAIQANDSHYQVFSEGYNNDVFIRWPKTVSMKDRNNPIGVLTDRDVMYGRVWPDGPAAFPDFLKNATIKWWKKWIRHTHDALNIPFDAIWIDMNEPINFDSDWEVCNHRPCYHLKCPYSKYDDLSARIKPVWVHNDNTRLNIHALCMTGIQGENDQFLHYDVHSIYGLTESMATIEGVRETTGKRGFILSRSTFASSGRYAAHWLGDNTSLWEQMRQSIIGMLEMNLFGIAWVGADICGFNGVAQPEMCLRWSQLGAFYPFSRNHNSISSMDQDPAVWGQKGHPEVTDAARNALNIRYRLLPYLYTLFYHAHRSGDTVARPLMHEFSRDSKSQEIDQQFLWGSSLLISPFLFPGQKQVSAYLPSDLWYHADWKTLKFTPLNSNGENVNISDSDQSPPIHIRGGSVIPITEPAVNTEISRKNPIKLLIAPKNKHASGDLFWDDGESIDTIENGKYNYYEFSVSGCSLEISVVKSGYSNGDAQIIDGIILNGIKNGKHKIIPEIDSIAQSPVICDDNHVIIPVKINLHSKSEGNKWIMKWKIEGTNECNLLM